MNEKTICNTRDEQRDENKSSCGFAKKPERKRGDLSLPRAKSTSFTSFHQLSLQCLLIISCSLLIGLCWCWLATILYWKEKSCNCLREYWHLYIPICALHMVEELGRYPAWELCHLLSIMRCCVQSVGGRMQWTECYLRLQLTLTVHILSSNFLWYWSHALG